MGLSICFDLALPSDTPGRDAHALLTRLRDEAARLPFRAVSELVQLGPVELAGPSKLRGLAYERLADGVDTYAKPILERLWRDGLGLDEDAWPKLTSDLPSTAIGFAVAPGRGSEPAAFGLARFAWEDGPSRWSWWCCCKTQYASAISDEHLIQCHTSVIGLLDAAKRIGFECDVRDEASYFESRDTTELLQRVAEMNRIVARFAGAFSDAFAEAGGDTKRVQGAIFEHPDFERLETRD